MTGVSAMWPADSSGPPASWASISTDLLLAELRRRKDDPQAEKPQCGSNQKGWYDTSAHVFALFLIFILSTLCCGFPLISKKTTTGSRQRAIIFYSGHGGTGVLMATAFVHLLPTAFESLTDPCLPYFFSKGYTPLPGLIAMISALVVVGVESYLTARGAGHSHNHHDMWDDDQEDLAAARAAQRQFRLESVNVRRRESIRSQDLSLDDAEASQGLVAGVSPLPESSPAMPHTNGKHKASVARRESGDAADMDGEDSDLALDMDELDPVAGNQYSSLKPTSQRDDRGDGLAGASDEDDQKRMLLQCLLLEAGILFHSIFIGMAISVATGPPFVVFLIAISFHQSFEGLALGTRIAAIRFPKNSMRPWLMVLAYGTTTPIGQAIGLVVHKLYDPHSMAGLLVVGFMNAISSGLLVYAALVQLLAPDFLSETSYKVLKGRRRLHAFLAVLGGAFLMALVGAFA